MINYKVMAKGNHDKRYHCYGHHTEGYHADKNAESLTRSLWTKSVKVIAIDDNGIKNEIIYK